MGLLLLSEVCGLPVCDEVLQTPSNVMEWQCLLPSPFTVNAKRGLSTAERRKALPWSQEGVWTVHLLWLRMKVPLSEMSTQKIFLTSHPGLRVGLILSPVNTLV